MGELERRVTELEGNLLEIKSEVKELLREVKALMARDQNSLAELTPEVRAPSRGPVIVVAPIS